MRRRKPNKDLSDLLAADIRAGVYSPGSWLKQIDLQRRYDASRSEIRKSLETLFTKRIIRYEPNRGYYVHREDGAATDEIRDIRIMLETSAAEVMVEKVQQDQINGLYTLAQRFVDQIRSDKIMEIYETNIAFHTALLATSGNASLVDLISELRLRTPPAPASQWSSYARIEKSGQEHFAMVDALADKDAARLKAVIRAHIAQSDN
ncbi:GntR family transcriptional regulator [Cohaesibacter haloalkalitolerans]|uniref:GntR family transcriptional regulator n=1 Tax=Cohaesibacter haloalkalitolerans TaxID=1162980 RepID=UPI001FE054DB|nr:GntR family transcriptional regulator [Cohaesibacter haloalkalitolerans]